MRQAAPHVGAASCEGRRRRDAARCCRRGSATALGPTPGSWRRCRCARRGHRPRPVLPRSRSDGRARSRRTTCNTARGPVGGFVVGIATSPALRQPLESTPPSRQTGAAHCGAIGARTVPMIELDDVRKVYADGHVALRGVSLRVDRADHPGPARAVRLRQDDDAQADQPAARPDRRPRASSTASDSATRRSRSLLRRRIGYVVQEAGLFPHLTARPTTPRSSPACSAGRRRAARTRPRAVRAARARSRPASADRYPGPAQRRPTPARRPRPRPRGRSAASC